MPRPDLHPFTRVFTRVRSGALVSFAVVAASVWFVVAQLQPVELVRDTIPTGGDNAGHLWGPAILKDTLLPSLRLSGWSPDWLAGFPAFHFYMVVPALMVALGSYVVPYNVAFKLVTVLGPVTLPVAAWASARLGGARRPAPELAAVATVPFLFDRYHTIWGGNLLATLSGEFAYAISLSASTLFVGLSVAGMRTGRHRAVAAAVLAFAVLSHPIPPLLAAAGALSALAVAPSWGRVRWLGTVGVTGVAVAGFWLLPFWWRRDYLTDLGYVRDTRYWDRLLRLDVGPDRLHWVLALAVVGAAAAVVHRIWWGRAVVGATLLLAGLYLVTPQGQLWNARILPLYYLGLFLLAAMGAATVVRMLGGGPSLLARPGGRVGPMAAVLVAIAASALLAGLGGARGRSLAGMLAGIGVVLAVAETLRWLASVRSRWGPTVVSALTVGALLAVLAVVGLPLRVLPGGSVGADGVYGWGPLSATGRSQVPTYAHWNYSGMEAKQGSGRGGGYDEYTGLVDTMRGLGETRGCGRAMWEYARELDRYGSPMALMLLPRWTDGCIGSMEGLYFESSATTPYHFLTQTELSVAPSQAMRGLRYGRLDIDAGVRHLQLLGVRYYLAFSPPAVAAADAHPDLSRLATSGPWVVYAVDGSAVVEPLPVWPVVVDAAGDWLDVAQPAFLGSVPDGVVLAADGPDGWPHVDAGALSDPVRRPVPQVPAPGAVVDRVVSDDDRISFEVDEPGAPILVKASYFPTWRADGADGPYRVGPNLMVVVPTGRQVTLRHTRTAIDHLGLAVSLAGIAGGVVLARRRPIDVGPPGERPACIVSAAGRVHR